jgi:DNA repair exonuclease SbcCD nuclease subunit
MHQTVEGAQVGTADYTFRSGGDIVVGSQIPGGFAAVLCGHIHRSQVLAQDLRGRPLATPVIYPGSVERTSFAERLESKHYVRLEIAPTGDGVGQLTSAAFVPLPARPMISLTARIDGHSPASLIGHLRKRLAELDVNSVVRVGLEGASTWEPQAYLTAACLRELAPRTMNVSLAIERSHDRSGRRRSPVSTGGTSTE